jgi:hypothetical protein
MPDRIVPLYRPRELLDASLCQSEAGFHLLCISDSQRYILRRLLSYAHREIQFFSEINEGNTYTTPSASELDAIQATVDDLEDMLMADCSDFLEAIQCICSQLTLLRQAQASTGIFSNAQEYIETGAFSWGVPPPVGSPAINEEMCALAQTHWQAMYESWTEFWAPAWASGFSYLIPAAATAIVAFTGGLALPAIIGVYLTADQITRFFSAYYEGAVENCTNWLFSHKDEIICASFLALYNGGGEVEAIEAVDTVIAATGDLSVGEKLFFNLVNFFGYRVAKVAQDNLSEWYLANFTPGYCQVCIPEASAWWWFFRDNSLFDAEPNACDIGSYADMPYHYITDDASQLPVGQAGWTASIRVRGYINKALWDFPPAPGDVIIRVVLKEEDDVYEFIGSQFPDEGIYDISIEHELTGIVARVDFQMQGTNAVCTGWYLTELLLSTSA